MAAQRAQTSYPSTISARFSHCAISTTDELVVRMWLLSHTDVPIIIIIIRYRPRLPLLKPEWAGGALAGKDSSITLRSSALITILRISIKV